MPPHISACAKGRPQRCALHNVAHGSQSPAWDCQTRLQGTARNGRCPPNLSCSLGSPVVAERALPGPAMKCFLG